MGNPFSGPFSVRHPPFRSPWFDASGSDGCRYLICPSLREARHGEATTQRCIQGSNVVRNTTNEHTDCLADMLSCPLIKPHINLLVNSLQLYHVGFIGLLANCRFTPFHIAKVESGGLCAIPLLALAIRDRDRVVVIPLFGK